MKALAFNVSQAVTYETLSADMGNEGEPKRTRVTVRSYLDMLDALFVIEDLGGWEPPLLGKQRVRVKPKRYFVDPSLPAALIGATPSSLRHDTQTLGGLFETMCLRDLRTYLSALPGASNQVHYYRDENGLEVDFVVELSDGRWGAIEAKLSDSKADDEAASKLLKFRDKICRRPKAQVKEPEFLAFLVGKGDIAYRRDDGILVIPLAALEL
ncbi:MAG: ATP-binding protein [Coriobacteriales bacterium]|jgi:predicted AAA+ superfamily ATPase